jgi:hypothetical protein
MCFFHSETDVGNCLVKEVAMARPLLAQKNHSPTRDVNLPSGCSHFLMNGHWPDGWSPNYLGHLGLGTDSRDDTESPWGTSACILMICCELRWSEKPPTCT